MFISRYYQFKMNNENSEKIIEIKGLSKKFKDVLAVDELDLNVYRGDVFGFLGPNGAGKSTTIRMLVSLIFPTRGEIRIFGKKLLDDRNNILRRIGAIIEKPDFYRTLTAYKNIEILGKISGTDTSKKHIMEVLDTVGLADRAFSKVKTYSHGMKQRLGIAQALIHNPELIILDEPTTGLDPQGMKDIRDLILHLSKDLKKTIFLSSHILYEVQIVSSRMIIINKGKKLVEGSVQDLLNSTTLNVEFTVSDLQKARDTIGLAKPDTMLQDSSSSLLLEIDKGAVPFYNKLLVDAGIDVFSIVHKNSLEEYFLSLTEKEEDVKNNKH